jgi:hypothetical protein
MARIGRKEAVALIRDALHGSRDELAAAMVADPHRWHVDHHFGLGVDVRNLLLRHGYPGGGIYGGEGDDLDEEWWMLTQEAITGKRVERMTLSEHLRRSEEIAQAVTAEELEAVRRQVAARPATEEQRDALAEQLHLRASFLGIDVTQLPPLDLR